MCLCGARGEFWGLVLDVTLVVGVVLREDCLCLPPSANPKLGHLFGLFVCLSVSGLPGVGSRRLALCVL
jgi:hypothetical protein